MADDPLTRGVDRSTFLARVRRSLDADGGVIPVPLPDWKSAGEPLKREDLITRFADEARAADATVSRATEAELRDHLGERIAARNCSVAVRADTPLLRSLNLDARLHEHEVSVFVAQPDAMSAREGLRSATARAQIGITEADFGVAESGTLVLLHRPAQGRAVSLLPPLHLAILPTRRLLPDLEALFERIGRDTPPSALTLITGPSRTADIEMVMTRGIHGPGELHVVLVEAGAEDVDPLD